MGECKRERTKHRVKVCEREKEREIVNECVRERERERERMLQRGREDRSPVVHLIDVVPIFQSQFI